ncbi:hypothetical protein U5U50_02255 [Mycoplasma sp. 888]|uniref:hypothetical protein n=1 Tax=Mycoplasma sp. 888 TaxID=3108483 RepID=UPI002D77B9F8|nr:hypothetical protein [Mycoplasma sp. 888]WRQ25611.1 hypothetical protein U5U50_02255 [Mycoplasma sp. 888]
MPSIKINNLKFVIAYNSHLKKIIKQFHFTIEQFANYKLIKKQSDNSVYSKKEMSISSNTLNELIDKFLSYIEFEENTTDSQKRMISDFYHFMFYQLIGKYYNIDNFTFDIEYLENNQIKLVNNKSLSKKETKQEFDLLVNKVKRTYYYDFLDEFQKLPNYNTVLRSILKKVL